VISPGGIPQYTGDFAKVATAVTELRKHATGIRNSGQDVHSRFQATAAYYRAPEAEQLLSSTQPVMDTADDFAAAVESLADALETFAAEAKPHADKLKQLKLDAIDFVDSVEGDDDWTEDQDKVDRHQALMDGVAAAVVGFQEAERDAANKINAISPALCRPAWVEDDGTHGTGMYGVSADMLKGVEDLPWGSPEGRTYDRWSLDWWGHGAKSWVWDGIVKDSIWGSIDGLGTLIGYHGAEARDQAWDGLRRTGVGAYAYGMDLFGQGDHLSDWERDSKDYAKEFAKGFIAYDMQEEDPARAHAVVSFNLLTVIAGPAAGISKLGKGGSFAKAAGTVAKIGDALDPLSGGLKAAKSVAALPKVSEVLANVSNHLQLPKTRFPDGALDLSDRYRVDKDGNLIALNPDGTPNTAPVRREPALADRMPSAQAGEHALVGGGRAPEAAGHADGHTSPRGGHATGDGGGAGDRPPHHPPAIGGGNHGSGIEHGGDEGATTNGHSADPDGGGQHPEHASGTGEHAHDGNVSDAADTSGRDGDGGSSREPSVRQKGVWPARSDIPGPAAGEELKRPHARHTISGSAKGEIKERNSLILRGYYDDIDKDIAEIAQGRAKLTEDGNRYEINGRTYGVEPGGRVYPDSGPGIIIMDRNEYAALQQVVRAKGDLNAAPQLTRNPRFVNNPEAVQKALDIYNGTYR
jgi:hypothetical protein